MSDMRPNIVYIITDQQRYDTINALGFPHMETPNLDRLVREGTTFTGCYATGLSCAPSRASIFTNLYPHTSGILRNACLWRRSWLDDFATAGYYNVNIGKMHTWPHNTPCGFHERYNIENKDRFFEARYYFDEWDRALAANGLTKQRREEYRKLPDYRERLGAFEWELPERLQSDMFTGDLAQWWLKSYPKTDQLFFQIGFPGPHPPYDPTRRYIDRYMDKDIPIKPIVAEDLAGQPYAYRKYREHCFEVDHDSVAHRIDLDPSARFRQRAYYCANMTMIDDKIGEVMNELDTQGYLDNTIIVFTSDHGDCLGDHGLSQKWSSYEQIVHMPMIVWGPNSGIAQGHTCDALCQHFDISHALHELAGVPLAEPHESVSALPALRGEAWDGRDVVYAEQCKDGNNEFSDFTTMVRTRDWKLTHFLGNDDGQLHDMRNDPDEMHNLWDDPSAASVKREMLDRLMEWRMYSQYNCMELMAEYR